MTKRGLKRARVNFFIVISLMFQQCMVHTAGTQKKNNEILFVGNSLTASNDMPETLQKMFDFSHLTYKVSKSTLPGFSLSEHLNIVDSLNGDYSSSSDIQRHRDTTATEKILMSRNWNYIILQEATIYSVIPEARNFLVIPAINEIKKKVKNKNAKYFYFKTWPLSRKYPTQECTAGFLLVESLGNKRCCSPIMNNLDEAFQLVNSAADSIKLHTGVPSAPITDCFREYMQNNPESKLLDKTDHPTALGSYLIACIFYKLISQHNATTIGYFANVAKKDAMELQSIVDKYL